MDKTIKVLIIILLSILILGSLGAFAILFTTQADFDMYKTSKVYDNDIEEEFNAINVDTDSLDVKIIKSNDEKVNVKIYDKDEDSLLNYKDFYYFISPKYIDNNIDELRE